MTPEIFGSRNEVQGNITENMFRLCVPEVFGQYT